MSPALFGVFRVTTGDSWSEIARYGVSGHLMCGLVLTHGVVAVLLDELTKAVAQEKQILTQADMDDASHAFDHKGFRVVKGSLHLYHILTT
jgi:hypothetical protein